MVMFDLTETCLYDQEAALEMSLGEKKKKRRPRSDPNKLDLNNLSGYENVSVINRDTGKKVPSKLLKVFFSLINNKKNNPGRLRHLLVRENYHL